MPLRIDGTEMSDVYMTGTKLDKLILTGTEVFTSAPSEGEVGYFTEGGYYFGTIEVSGITYYLVAADIASGETIKNWGDYGTSVAGADSLVDGYQNTIDLEAGTKPAADFCRNLTIGGYNDWYLPAKDELNLLYINHAALESAGAGSFSANSYWASTEYNSNAAWRQAFTTGAQYSGDKDNNNYVRAIRRFAA